MDIKLHNIEVLIDGEPKLIYFANGGWRISDQTRLYIDREVQAILCKVEQAVEQEQDSQLNKILPE